MRFFILLLFITSFTTLNLAQTPGGVKDYEYWFISDEIKDTQRLNTIQNSLNYRQTKLINNKSVFEDIKSNKASGDATFFFVIKPSFQQDSSILTDVILSERRISIQSDRIKSKNESRIKSFTEKKPYILSYVESIKPDTVAINKSYNSNRFEGEIAEVIIYPKLLSKLNRRKIETYLSLKYGISLRAGSDYVNSLGDTIWKGNEKSNFPHRLTGIGFDFESNFNNRQSTNIDENQFLTIGFGAEIQKKNENYFTGNTEINYFLWSDNDGEIEFDNKNEFLSTLDRIWFTKKIGKFQGINNISLKFDFDALSYDGNSIFKEDSALTNPYWLIVSENTTPEIDFYSAKFLESTKGISNSNIAEFNGINISDFKDNTVFTVGQAPELFAITKKVSDNCHTDIKIKIIGGVAPYNISVFDLSNHEYDIEKISENEYVLRNLEANEYIYYIGDSKGNSFENNINLLSESYELISISDIYLHDNQSKTIDLIDYLDENNFEVTWLKNQEFYGTGYRTIIRSSGDYELMLEDEKGCIKSTPFRVFELPKKEWSGIYPNPVNVNENFFIRLPQGSSAIKNITIHDQSGRVIKRKTIQSDGTVYADRFHQSGIYTIIVESQYDTNQYTIVIK